MDDQTAKTVAIFDRPFKLPGFNETLPAGEYNIRFINDDGTITKTLKPGRPRSWSTCIRAPHIRD